MRIGRAERLGAIVGMLGLVTLVLVQPFLAERWRDDALDLLLPAARWLSTAPAGPVPPIVVVDIDRASLEQWGPWPWPRSLTARLVAAIAATRPAAVGLDILFAEPDDRSPAALARRLAGLTDRPELMELAKELPDGDALLADRLLVVPSVLGFVLDPDGTDELAGPAFRTTTRPALAGLWRTTGALGPTAPLAAVGSGLGALSLPGGRDGTVRDVPLLVVAGRQVLPGLALELLRVAAAAPAYRLEAQPDGRMLLGVGQLSLALPVDGLTRLIPPPRPPGWQSLAASDLLAGRAAPPAGAIVLIGSSAPETGGLRPTAWDPLTPSVAIHATALRQLAEGRILQAPLHRQSVEALAALGMGGAAILAGLVLTPLAGASVVLLTILAWLGACLWLAGRAELLVDPVGPGLIALSVFLLTALLSFALTRRRERRLRRRFEQRLHPAVVARLADRPDLLKLAGEYRTITVLATDLEGFTALTHRLEPETLISLLDGYLEGITRIVVAHGGMIDKIVGDAVHGMFNAPLDLPDHAGRALAAAREISAWTERHRALPLVRPHQLGRTRIGIESGRVVVGDVGIGTRLDYTAYGDAVNLAVRLEALNKELGTTILIGPEAIKLLDGAGLRLLEPIEVRGRDGTLPIATVQ